MRLRSLLITAIGLFAFSTPIQVLSQELVPLSFPIPGYYAFNVDNRQLILNTESGAIVQNANWGINQSYGIPLWERVNRRLSHYRGFELHVDDPLGMGVSRQVPLSEADFFVFDWSLDGQTAIGSRITGLADPSDQVMQYHLDTSQSEVVAEFTRQESLPDGLVFVGLNPGLSANPVYGAWLSINFDAVQQNQFVELVSSSIITTSVPVLYNIETQQRVYLSEYLHDPHAVSTYGMWSHDGIRLYLFEESGWVNELGFTNNGSVTQIASARIIQPMLNEPEYNLAVASGILGTSDLLILYRSSNSISDPPNRYIRIARIVDGAVLETDWFTLNEDALNTENISSGSFLLTADAEQQQALSCIIDVGPAAQLQTGAPGRVTMTDGSGTRLRLEPGVTGDILQTMPDTTPFIVLSGPYCIDSMKWWQVQLSDGTTGWAAEGSTNGYFLEPLSTETPTPTPTPSPTPTPAAFQRLRVSAICSDDPATSRRWRIRNPNPYPVPFTWEMRNSPGGQQGTGTAPVAVNGVPSAVILTTATERWIPIIEVTANNRSDFAINLGIPCDLPSWLEP